MRKGGPEVGGVPIWDGFCTDGGPEVGGGGLEDEKCSNEGGPLCVTFGEEQIGDPPRDGKTSPRIRALQFALHHLHLQ